MAPRPPDIETENDALPPIQRVTEPGCPVKTKQLPVPAPNCVPDVLSIPLQPNLFKTVPLTVPGVPSIVQVPDPVRLITLVEELMLSGLLNPTASSVKE